METDAPPAKQLNLWALGRCLLSFDPQGAVRSVALLAATLLVTGTYVGQALFIARVLSRVINGGSFGSIVWLVGAIVLLQFARVACVYWRDAAAIRLAARIKAAVRGQAVEKLFALGPGWTRRERTGHVQSLLVDGLEFLDPLVARFLPQVLATVVGTTIIGALLIVIDPFVGLAIMACAIAAAMLPIVSGHLVNEPMLRWYAGYKQLYAAMLDAVQGISTLKALGASKRYGGALTSEARQFANDSVRLTGIAIIYVSVVALFVALGTSIAVVVGALRLIDGQLSQLQLLTILLLASECFRPLQSLEKAYHASYQAGPAGNDILAFLALQPSVTGPAEAAPDLDENPEPPSITFEHVTFRYREGDAPALDDVSIRLNSGETLAIVGRSGSGKSTLVSLLLRIHDPDAGLITLDGSPISTLPLEQLRRQIAIVSQDTYLFHGSVRENLLIARPDATDNDLREAASAAFADDFIRQLPEGYETIVGSRGLKLSGGQRQRLAIARALLKRAPILVLDEATSSVDTASESTIQEALAAVTEHRTTLIVAHRLSTIRNADRIVVLERGRVMEAGSHETLLADEGIYADLVLAQRGTA